jgi:hypothetical protein
MVEGRRCVAILNTLPQHEAVGPAGPCHPATMPLMAPLCSPSRVQTNLSLLHACVHCRASKTACTDQRPCTRCRRLGLECSSDRGELRKRACKSCHSAKVACGGSGVGEACPRCKRLGLECVPRDLPSQGPRRKRVRAELVQAHATLATYGTGGGAYDVLDSCDPYARAALQSGAAQLGVPTIAVSAAGYTHASPAYAIATPAARALYSGSPCDVFASASAATDAEELCRSRSLPISSRSLPNAHMHHGGPTGAVQLAVPLTTWASPSVTLAAHFAPLNLNTTSGLACAHMEPFGHAMPNTGHPCGMASPPPPPPPVRQPPVQQPPVQQPPVQQPPVQQPPVQQPPPASPSGVAKILSIASSLLDLARPKSDPVQPRPRPLAVATIASASPLAAYGGADGASAFAAAPVGTVPIPYAAVGVPLCGTDSNRTTECDRTSGDSSEMESVSRSNSWRQTQEEAFGDSVTSQSSLDGMETSPQMAGAVMETSQPMLVTSPQMAGAAATLDALAALPPTPFDLQAPPQASPQAPVVISVRQLSNLQALAQKLNP